MFKKLKNKFSELKFYLKVVSSFKDLNYYVYKSSILLSRLESILSSDLSETDKLSLIFTEYGSFKVDYFDKDFVKGVKVDNPFIGK